MVENEDWYDHIVDEEVAEIRKQLEDEVDYFPHLRIVRKP